ncbi:MAG TPA: dihydropteroate synthase [Chitinophagales bacterium]|nr:dihydropteroate synthase [Chitinophagales bacterium]HMX05050.1 dihydropteroate synthase [Chitinophagales bacterium]HMZ89597.1 dihydropteroate synthase [Chitinophagales bacterium]HNA59211.1 dihydropteroate synthase [Chitinophagales bacterium]HNF68479.1 dihydropteroate synthase [Chitinophagales bacterium]
MGILNVTPDSFYDGGRFVEGLSAVEQAERMVKAGVDIIDIGGMSTRPGADIISPREEMDRVLPVIAEIRVEFPEMLISIDTVYGRTAREALKAGADIINDVSAGTMDSDIFQAAIDHQAPYILMHMQGNPQTMQLEPYYEDVVEEVLTFLSEKTTSLKHHGLQQVILDPGFGFGKTLTHNYQLLASFEKFLALGCPVLAGVSRKSMICKLLHISPDHALNGSTALHALLLQKGAHILRVHDVKEAAQTRAIFMAMQNPLGL